MGLLIGDESPRPDAWLLMLVLAAVIATAVWLLPPATDCYRPDLDQFVPCEVAP